MVKGLNQQQTMRLVSRLKPEDSFYSYELFTPTESILWLPIHQHGIVALFYLLDQQGPLRTMPTCSMDDYVLANKKGYEIVIS